MATKMKRLSLHLRTFLLMISLCVPSDGYHCPYGQNCRFEPAASGQTPPCAKPGLTFCTSVDPYPEQLIRRLIEAGQYDIRTLLMDESRDDFNVKKGDYPYGPNSIPNVDQISLVHDESYNKFNSKYNHDIFSQKTPLQPPSPVDPSPYNVNTFQSTNFTKFGYNGYHTPSYWNNPTKALRPNVVNPNYGASPNIYNSPNLVNSFDSNAWFRQSNSGVTEYNPNEWWKYISPSRSDSVTVQRSISYPPHNIRKKRNAELVKASMKRKLTGAEALRIALGLASEDDSAERPRRQAADTEELCPSSSRFITPRAALNNKGKWTYVVNMPDTMTQLVRVEICRSDYFRTRMEFFFRAECSRGCALPSTARRRTPSTEQRSQKTQLARYAAPTSLENSLQTPSVMDFVQYPSDILRDVTKNTFKNVWSRLSPKETTSIPTFFGYPVAVNVL